ncbi:uncharacterized protein [Rutidosis leptorrhynchoides]|uniref:uncharacterized protein n=1 Tax=Rutidosis leptorrhynchoides TaxID=125765 RepID=UPI003A9A1B95
MPPPNTEEFDMFNYGVENVRSFVQHCRPVIIVDGAHLKAGYSGTNLVAVAMDGNNGILPLAYGIGGGETNELTFISDRAASIAHGVSTVFPEAFHCFCARHLFGSIKTKSNKFKYFEWHYWKMVKAYRGSDFEDHLSVFRRRLRASYNYLEQVGFHKWYRSRAEHSVSLTSTVTPYAERKLGKRTRKSRRWQAIPSTNNLIEVRDGRKNGMVNLDDKVCSCGQWQLSGIPCGHVIAAARLFGVEDVTQFVSHWFTTQTYINTYFVSHWSTLRVP